MAVYARDFTVLGGTFPEMLAHSGVAHFLAENETHAINMVRLLLSYLPQNNTEAPPFTMCSDPPDRMDEFLRSVVPTADDQSHNVKQVILAVVDYGTFMEVQPYFARNAVAGFARMDGHVVSIVGQPARFSGRRAGHRRQRQDRSF